MQPSTDRASVRRAVLLLKVQFLIVIDESPIRQVVESVQESNTHHSIHEFVRQSIPIATPLKMEFHASELPHPMLSRKALIPVLLLPFSKSIEEHEQFAPPAV